MIADDVALMAFGRRPGAALRSAIREMPAQQERVLRFGARSDVALDAKRSDRIAQRRVGAEIAVARKIVPERKRSDLPASAAFPSGYVRDVSAISIQSRQCERSGEGIGFREKRILHEQTLHAIRFAELVGAALMLTGLSMEYAIETAAVFVPVFETR